MAGKLLKETKDKQVKRKRQKKDAEEDNIYKIDLDNDNIIKVVDDDDDDADEIFGNVNRWLTEDNLEKNLKTLKENEKKTRKKRLTKIEEGIKSSKKAKTTRKSKLEKETEEESESEEIQAIQISEDEEVKNKKATKKAKTKPARTTTKKAKAKEKEETQGEIKIYAENDTTEVLLKHNHYRIELQKSEYNIYTETSDTSYIIVRDPKLRIISDEVYLILEKQGEDYEITTNQDFKINYVIDNLQRKDNVVNFKLTNLTEIIADDEGLTFEIDEEKVIENNLEDNHTLIISEEDGKVYLPYTKDDIKNEVIQNKGTKISEVIENNYIFPLDKYKNSIRARFREGYNLMYKKEGKSKRSAILLGIELMFETNLHPAIISACKNLEELDIYLDCLEDNELEKFSCFKIIYKSLPTLRKKAKFQEF